MTPARTCLVDSDVFITAKNLYWSLDTCPGFWKSLVCHHREGRVFRIDRVRSKPLTGQWTEGSVRRVKEHVPTQVRHLATCGWPNPRIGSVGAEFDLGPNVAHLSRVIASPKTVNLMTYDC